MRKEELYYINWVKDWNQTQKEHYEFINEFLNQSWLESLFGSTKLLKKYLKKICNIR